MQQKQINPEFYAFSISQTSVNSGSFISHNASFISTQFVMQGNTWLHNKGCPVQSHGHTVFLHI